MLNLLKTHKVLEPVTLVLIPRTDEIVWAIFDYDGMLSRHGVQPVDTETHYGVAVTTREAVWDLLDLYSVPTVLVESPSSHSALEWMLYGVIISSCELLGRNLVSVGKKPVKEYFGMVLDGDVIEWARGNGVLVEGKAVFQKDVSWAVMLYHYCYLYGVVFESPEIERLCTDAEEGGGDLRNGL